MLTFFFCFFVSRRTRRVDYRASKQSEEKHDILGRIQLGHVQRIRVHVGRSGPQRGRTAVRGRDRSDRQGGTQVNGSLEIRARFDERKQQHFRHFRYVYTREKASRYERDRKT